jgi:hypothetical protein
MPLLIGWIILGPLVLMPLRAPLAVVQIWYFVVPLLGFMFWITWKLDVEARRGRQARREMKRIFRRAEREIHRAVRDQR